jgi:nitrogen fixation protein FixH
MNQEKKALIWPYAIGASIVLVFGFCVTTVVVSFERPVEQSDLYMRNYHETNADINDIIEKEIAFKKHYNVEYVAQQLDMNGSVLKYKISDKEGNGIDSAKIHVVITRPNNHKYDRELNATRVENGIYSFDEITLPKPGRWDIMAWVSVDGYERYYNIKADTRYESTFEY